HLEVAAAGATAGLELGQRIQDRALGGAPAHERALGVRRAVEAELARPRNLARGLVELAHALARHGDAVGRALGDVAARVVLVAGGPEDGPLLAGKRARADAVRRQGVAQVAIAPSVAVRRRGT